MTMHPKRDVVIVINPGSTSSKIALFKAGKMVAERTLNHSLAELSQFDAVIAQKDFRMQAIQEFFSRSGLFSKRSAGSRWTRS